jgi:hypothetical protein
MSTFLNKACPGRKKTMKTLIFALAIAVMSSSVMAQTKPAAKAAPKKSCCAVKTAVEKKRCCEVKKAEKKECKDCGIKAAAKK